MSLKLGLGLGASGGSTIGFITYEGEPLTLDGELITSGTEENVELATALAALTDALSIISGGTLTTDMNGVLIPDGWELTIANGPNETRLSPTSISGGNISASGDVSGDTLNIGDGGLSTITGNLALGAQLYMASMQTSDGDTGTLWQDNAASRTVKVSV